MRGDEVVAWSEVDAEWWDHVQHARAVHEEVVEAYRHEPGVESIEMGRGEGTIAGHATSTVNVLVSDEETAKTLVIPDEIDGIPIVVEVGHIVDTE